MQIALLLFEGITTLDAVGPYEVLRRLPGAEVHFVAKEPGEMRDDNGSLGSRLAMRDETTLAWVRSAHAHTRWTTSVCTGSLILGAAGLLHGLRATTHWLSLPVLEELGAIPTTERVVEEGRIVTAAGVSAGIDMALRLTQLMEGDETAQAIQLSIEYHPHPPLDAGSPDKAPAHIVEGLKRRAARQASQPART